LAPTRARTPLRLSVDSFQPQGRQPLVARTGADGFDGPAPAPSARTTQQALAEMETLLGGAPTSFSSVDGAEVVQDGVSADDRADQDPISGRYKTAMSQLQANEQLVNQKLESLTPEQRNAYTQVMGQVMTIFPAGDPVAALALQKLLLSNKLTEGTSLKDGKTVLDGLLQVATGPVGEGFSRQQLLANLIQEIATPEAICQGTKGTCTVTTVAIQLARDNPAEYVRLVAGLASPSGEVLTAGGRTLHAERDALGATDGRTNVQELLAPALMEYAYPRLDYRNEGDDGHYRGDTLVKRGLNSQGLDRVLEAIYGESFVQQDVRKGLLKRRPDVVMKKIEEQLAQGKEVLLGLKWGDSAHKVLVTGTENVNGTEYLLYINPWGREERVPKDELLTRLIDFNYAE
jgi:hypothetical protein